MVAALTLLAPLGAASPAWARSAKKVVVGKKVKASNNNVGSNNSVNVGSPPPECTVTDPNLGGTEITVERGQSSTTITVNLPDEVTAPGCT